MSLTIGSKLWPVSLTRHFTGFPPVYLEVRPLLEEAMSPLTHGVPHGVILVLLLFSLYMLPLAGFILFGGISYYFYADDIQLYVPFKSHQLDRL